MHTSVETMFLYKAEVVLLGSCSRFLEVPLVQRAALRAFLDGSRVDSTQGPSSHFFFFFPTPFFARFLFFFCYHPFCVLRDLHFHLSSAPHTPPTLTKLWGIVLYIPTCPTTPLISLFVNATPAKHILKPINFVAFAVCVRLPF